MSARNKKPKCNSFQLASHLALPLVSRPALVTVCHKSAVVSCDIDLHREWYSNYLNLGTEKAIRTTVLNGVFLPVLDEYMLSTTVNL